MSKKSYGYRKIYKKKAKWSSVFVNVTGDLKTVPGQQSDGWVVDLCSNASNTTAAPTATIIKTGNFKVSFEVETGAGNYQFATGRAFIMFVPQGVTVNVDWPQLHPEYIMGWRSLQVGGAVSAVTVSSKLKRNLNSGDRIVMIVQVFNLQTRTQEQPNNIYVQLAGACTYVCRAN